MKGLKKKKSRDSNFISHKNLKISGIDSKMKKLKAKLEVLAAKDFTLEN